MTTVTNLSKIIANSFTTGHIFYIVKDSDSTMRTRSILSLESISTGAQLEFVSFGTVLLNTNIYKVPSKPAPFPEPTFLIGGFSMLIGFRSLHLVFFEAHFGKKLGSVTATIRQ